MEEMHKLHQDSKAYIAMLDDPARDADQKPHEVVMALGLREGERIADIGAGSGYFSLRFAQHVGAGGQVLAVDINPDMIVHLNQRVRDAGLGNVRTILALPDDPLLAPSSVDRIFICDTWHHIGNHPQYLATLKRALKPGGQIVIIDFQKKAMTVGPPAEMRLAREDVVAGSNTTASGSRRNTRSCPIDRFSWSSPRWRQAPGRVERWSLRPRRALAEPRVDAKTVGDSASGPQSGRAQVV